MREDRQSGEIVLGGSMGGVSGGGEKVFLRGVG